MMNVDPMIAANLLGNPLTLHNLAGTPQATGALAEVLEAIATRGVEVASADEPGDPGPSPLSARQEQISRRAERVNPTDGRVRQSGFPPAHVGDSEMISAFLDEMYAYDDAQRRELADFAREIAREARGQEHSRIRAKSRDQAMANITGKYEGDAARVLDLAASSISFQYLEHLYLALELILDSGNIEIVMFEDRFKKPMPGGYRDLQLRVRLSNGHIGELRLHLVAVDQVAEWEHIIYEARRDIRARAGEPEDMKSFDRALYYELLRAQLRSFKEALSESENRE